jgi:mRNA interferase MazF
MAESHIFNNFRKLMVKKSPKRGEIWWVDFGKENGSKVTKKRPGVIISNDISNSVLDRYQIVPLTSNSEKIFPSECKIVFKKKTGKAMTDQVTTVHVSFLDKRGGKVTAEELLALEGRVMMQLGL